VIESIILIALFLLIRFLTYPFKKQKNSAVEKENNPGKQHPGSIIGKSTFVLSLKEQKPALIEKQEEPVSDSSGKMDIEIPLNYESENDILEEQEELERLGLKTNCSDNITFDEMMAVVNEVGNEQTKPTPVIGKLLYENENTNWVEQLATSSGKNANRIAALIDLHLGRLVQPSTDIKSDDSLIGFDIGEYV